MVKWKEIQGAVQAGRNGVGFHQGVRWYRKKKAGRVERIWWTVEAVKEKEEYRFAKAIQQGSIGGMDSMGRGGAEKGDME